MPTLLEDLKKKFQIALVKSFPDFENFAAFLELVPSSQEKFGHYQFNSAMKLGKYLKINPRQIAEKILANFNFDQTIERLEIEGPGFINITLKSCYLAKQVEFFLQKGIHLEIKKEKIIIDFSSPNIAKEMHVGHLRSTIIGDCLARIFEFLGHQVIRLNHLGDWGTSFGMLINYIQKFHQETLDNSSEITLADLMAWYKKAKILFDEDLSFKKQSQQAVVLLQAGNLEAIHIWKKICFISELAYQKIYELLNVKLINRGESFYNPYLASTVANLEAKGLVTISDGSKCIFLEGFKNRQGDDLPLLIQKSDGGYNYATTDMAAIYQRITEEKAERIIYITDAGQATHFQMIFAAAKKANYLNYDKVILEHIGFGFVLGSDGKRFRTRSGETEKLIDLLEAAIFKAYTLLKERNPTEPEEKMQQAAKILGLGAIKYADLAAHRLSDYVFSYDKMLKFEGNTAAFIMYAYVRVIGIKRKVNQEIFLITNQIKLTHKTEIALGLHLNQFGEVILEVTKELLPHRLTDYLYRLAEKFNGFFRDCRVEGSLEQDSRLLLIEATGQVLKQGLNLLGIEVLEKM